MSDGYRTYGYLYTDDNGNSLDDDKHLRRYVDVVGANKQDESSL
jgi:hypothetical protein